MVKAGSVSVIIPVYNGAPFIAEAIRSILNQTFNDLEVIVVDDASTDKTLEVVSLFSGDKRLKVISHAHNQGAAAARNTGIKAALNSEFIAFLDADDISLPSRIERQVHYLIDHPSISCLGSSVELFGDASGSMDMLCSPDDIAASTMFSCEFLMPTLVFRSSAMRLLKGVWFIPEYGANCDWEIIARMVMLGMKVANLPDRLVLYRRWESQMTAKIIDTIDCPATGLRSDMLAWYGIKKDQQDILSHMVASPCYWPIEYQHSEPIDQDRVDSWLDFIEQHSRAYFPSEKLNSSSVSKIIARCRAKNDCNFEVDSRLRAAAI